MKRGTIKSFREFLNERFKDSGPHRHNGGGHHRYFQRSRGYGDYLYHQDRAKFDVELADALAGKEYTEWKRP